MKNLRLIGFLMMLASSALFVNCTSDPIAGPSGTAGIDGTDGLDGLDGLDATADCRSCHSNEHRDPIKASYALSQHAAGETLGHAGGRADCTRCHSSEGFVNYIEGVPAVAIAEPSPIDCNACHNSLAGHRSFDFENDGNDYALRTLAPVQLIVDENVFIDGANDSDIMGTSNTCITCHQPRSSGPVATDGKYMNTSTYWGPHYGAQSTMLQGIQGANIVGTAVYPAPGTAGHKKGASCIACHMSEEGHSLVPSTPSSTTCTSCHDARPEVDGLAANMEILAAKLAEVVGQEIAKDANGDYQPVFEADGTTPVMVTGMLLDGKPAAGVFDIEVAEATWNYLFVKYDHSNGVHNPEYAKALIKNSIESLQ